MTNARKQELVLRLHDRFAYAQALRSGAASDPVLGQRRRLFRQWQADRLELCHRDLLGIERFAKAARFFLSDLYGPMDMSRRYEEAERVMSMTVKLMPMAGLEAMVDAVELDALSESLDAEMVAALGGAVAILDAAAYGDAYRRVGRRDDRIRQIGLIGEVGQALDRLARLPMARETLRMMRKPATLLGLGELQHFLERGFESFSAMHGAQDFLALIEGRETRLMESLFAGEDGLLGRPAVDWDDAPPDHQEGS